MSHLPAKSPRRSPPSVAQSDGQYESHVIEPSAADVFAPSVAPSVAPSDAPSDAHADAPSDAPSDADTGSRSVSPFGSRSGTSSQSWLGSRFQSRFGSRFRSPFGATCQSRRGGPRTAAIARVALGWWVGMTVAVSAAYACNVPVFRFALERWRADAYRVTIVHRGPLGDAERSVLERIEKHQESGSANLKVRVVDADRSEEPEDRELLDSLGDAALPMLVTQYPEALRNPLPIWGARFTPAMVDRLLESPLRKQLLDRLLAGDTAVWLLLESGDTAKNDAAATLLEGELKKLAAELKLPELSDLPDDTLFAKTPLKLAFSTLRVPRSEVEGPLTQMLLRCESDLVERDEPMVFPVFGRGRALLPLVGAGITAENVANSAKFLVGACSCEVKELNPGFDLLIAAPWDRLLEIDGQPLPIVSTRKASSGGSEREPELVPIPAGNGSSSGAANASSTANADGAANASVTTAAGNGRSEPNSSPLAATVTPPSSPPSPFRVMLLGVGGLGLLLTLIRVARSRKAASRCRR